MTKLRTDEEVAKTLNESAITGHISGRYLILIGGKKDREWDGGGYEENEYRYLDEYVAFLRKEDMRVVREMLVDLRDKFPNQGLEYYELQPNTEQWKVLGQANVMVEVEKIIKALSTLEGEENKK